jgi:hypothetical protein
MEAFSFSSLTLPLRLFSQSNGEYTAVTIRIPCAYRVPQGGEIDVEVQAIAGYMYYYDKQYHFVGQYGDWSTSQTLKVTSPSTSNDPVSADTTQFINSSSAFPTTSPFYIDSNATSTLIPTHPVTHADLPGQHDWTAVVVVALTLGFASLIVLVVVQQRRLRKIRS